MRNVRRIVPVTGLPGLAVRTIAGEHVPSAPAAYTLEALHCISVAESGPPATGTLGLGRSPKTVRQFQGYTNTSGSPSTSRPFGPLTSRCRTNRATMFSDSKMPAPSVATDVKLGRRFSRLLRTNSK